MSAVATLVPFSERPERALAGSAVLAGAVHLVLVAILFFGVRWSSNPPEAVEVELWSSPPAPVVEPAPPPPPRVEPAPEPRVEKPDIALKSPPAPKLRPETRAPTPDAKAVPREAKTDPKLARARQEDAKQRMLAELAKEQATMASERKDAELKALIAKEATDARAKALADWTAKLRAKIRGNIVLPPAISGNPEAVFFVTQNPAGDVISVVLRRSSGNAALDEAIHRGILKSAPLPKPDRAELFQREFELRYRPLDL